MWNKKTKITFAIIVILVISYIIFISMTMERNDLEVENRYTHTKAICNENNFCKDYKITCNRGEVESISPITGAFVQHNKNWRDPRENPSKLCENHRI